MVTHRSAFKSESYACLLKYSVCVYFVTFSFLVGFQIIMYMYVSSSSGYGINKVIMCFYNFSVMRRQVKSLSFGPIVKITKPSHQLLNM